MMQDFLSRMTGKRVDIFCGGTAALRGKVVKVERGVLHLVGDDDQMFYVAVEKVVVVSESRESDQRAGFISGWHK